MGKDITYSSEEKESTKRTLQFFTSMHKEPKFIKEEILQHKSCLPFHPDTEKHTFFSGLHGTLSKTDYILRHKASLNRYKKIE